MLYVIFQQETKTCERYGGTCEIVLFLQVLARLDFSTRSKTIERRMMLHKTNIYLLQ